MRARRSLVLASLAALAALLVGWALLRAGGGRLPGPSPARDFDPVAANVGCEHCHQEIAEEWRGSEHRSAHDDPVFQRALEAEPLAFCRGCHAPEAASGSATRTAQAGRASLGVACVTCHLAGVAVMASPRWLPSLAPHRLDRQRSFAADDACAGCHQFPFGDDERRPSTALMQRTLDEHRASPYADRPCAACHMPLVGEGRQRHRSHAFAATRDPASLARAVTVEASRPSPRRIELRVSPREVGHALPTGDLFRRLSVGAEVVGDDFQVLASTTALLGRRFGEGLGVDGSPIKIELGDDRPGAHGATPALVVLELGHLAVGRSIRWRVVLERALHVEPGRELQAVVSSEVELASGELAPRDGAP
jgi:hypothetical protein